MHNSFSFHNLKEKTPLHTGQTDYCMGANNYTGSFAPSRWFPPTLKQLDGQLAHVSPRASPMRSDEWVPTPRRSVSCLVCGGLLDPRTAFSLEKTLTHYQQLPAACAGKPCGTAKTGNTDFKSDTLTTVRGTMARRNSAVKGKVL